MSRFMSFEIKTFGLVMLKWIICIIFIYSALGSDNFVISGMGNGTLAESYVLTCSVKNVSKPPFSVSWKRNSTIIANILLQNKTSCIARDLNSTYNDSVFTCNHIDNVYTMGIPAKLLNNDIHQSNWTCNDASGGNISSYFILFVNIPVQNATLSVFPTDTDPVNVSVNQTILFKCETNGVRPPANITWFKNDSDISHLATDNITQLPGDLVISSSFLTYTGEKRDIESLIFCMCENVGNSSQRSNQKMLNILYGPDRIEIIPREWNYVVNETDNVTDITCKADCSPNCTVLWNRPNLENITGSVLKLTMVDKNYSGNYTCTVGNCVGHITSNIIKVVVNYKPQIHVMFLQNTTVRENGTISIRCIVESEPYSSFTWWFDDETLTISNNINVNNSEKIVKSQESDLKISNVQCLQMGNYSCEAENLIGSNRTTVEINVLCSPRLYQTNISNKIYIKDRDSINISAEIVAYPRPSLVWCLERNTSTFNVSMDLRQAHTNRFISNVFILNPTAENFGTYKLFAKNESGGLEDLYSFEVIPERQPDRPTNVQCTSSQNTITLLWKAGFNGGRNQYFYVYFKIQSQEDFKKYDKKIQDPGEEHNASVDITGLSMNTEYVFRVHAHNERNVTISTKSEAVFCNTTATDTLTSSATDIIALAAGLGTCFGIIVLLAITFAAIWMKRRNIKKETATAENRKRGSNNDGFDDMEGLKDNILYASSSDIAMKEQNDKNTYTTVNKKKQEERTSKAEASISRSGKSDMTDDNYKKNARKSGLIYAELLFKKDGKKRPFVIRGIENRTDYADIDLELKADPLPSDDSDKEEDQTKEENN